MPTDARQGVRFFLPMSRQGCTISHNAKIFHLKTNQGHTQKAKKMPAHGKRAWAGRQQNVGKASGRRLFFHRWFFFCGRFNRFNSGRRFCGWCFCGGRRHFRHGRCGWFFFSAWLLCWHFPDGRLGGCFDGRFRLGFLRRGSDFHRLNRACGRGLRGGHGR